MSPAVPPIRECVDCGGMVRVLRRPLRKLIGTRYWWHGLASLAGQPLRFCEECGSVYRMDGELVARGAAETLDETKLKSFRSDMIGMRDAFGTVFVSSQISIAWIFLGPASYGITSAVWAGAIGAVSAIPFGYFWKKTHSASRHVKHLRAARRRGDAST